MKIKVVYRDASFLAAHKPAGIATYLESRGGNVSGSTRPGCKEILEDQLNQRLFPVHRIDADTEGLVLFALDSRSAAGLIRLFKEHKVKKTYLAWCVGAVESKGSIKTPLKKHKTDQLESARTDFERIKSRGNFTLVRVMPYTGRFHQIRRHFDSIGHSLVGDPKYGSAESWAGFFRSNETSGLMLLAESVEFMHPVTRRPQKIKIKPPEGY